MATHCRRPTVFIHTELSGFVIPHYSDVDIQRASSGILLFEYGSRHTKSYAQNT